MGDDNVIKLSLAEAVKLKSVLNKRIHELEFEMNRVGFVEVSIFDLPTTQKRLHHVWCNLLFYDHVLISCTAGFL